MNASLDLDSQIQCTAKVNPQGSNNDVGKSNCEILLPTHLNNNQSTNENQPSENCKTICSSPKSYLNIHANVPAPLVSDVVPVPPASNADLMPKSSLDVEVNVPVPTVSDANLPPTRVMQVSKNETPCPFQPRTQALYTTRLAGGKTLVQAGHVSPRFWEITKFLHKGGGLSFILPI
jgi:hypothetical protein